jgi:glutamyl-tRNA synthetase
VIKVLALIKDRMKTLVDFVSLSKYFFVDPKVEPAKVRSVAGDKHSEILLGVDRIAAGLSSSDWTKGNLDKEFHDFAKRSGYTSSQALGTARVVVTGEDATPPLADLLEVLGKDTVLRRIRAALSTNSI